MKLSGCSRSEKRDAFKVRASRLLEAIYKIRDLFFCFHKVIGVLRGYQLPLAPPPPELPPPKPPKPPPPPNPPPPPQLLPPPPRPPLFMNMPSKNQIKPPPPALDTTERTISTITIPKKMAPADGPFAGRSSGGGRGGSGPSSVMPASAAITPATRCVMQQHSRAVLILPEQRNGLTTKATYFSIGQELAPAHSPPQCGACDR